MSQLHCEVKKFSNQIPRISFLDTEVRKKHSLENLLNLTEGMRIRKGEKYGKTEGKRCDQHCRGTQWPFLASEWRKRALKNPAVCGKAPSVGERCLHPAAEQVTGMDAAM